MSLRKILIINYGLGNLASLCNALSALDINWQIVSNINETLDLEFDGFILPGVGSFEAGINGLNERGFIKPIKKWAMNGIPCLGICLGMQLLMSESEESNNSIKGLELINGKVRSLPFISLPIPHIGWSPTFLNNETKENHLSHSLNGDFYYVHSYVAEPLDKQNILANFNYGNTKQTAAIIKNNILGVQFHPEKSQLSGLKFIKEFFKWIK